MKYLLFSLYGPFCAFGGVAVGERRGTWLVPSKSAVLGMVAASLGVERVDEEEHLRIQAALSFAVRTDAPGRIVNDYHTIQSPPKKKGRAFATRKEETAVPDLGTILSRREWIYDGFFTVALWNTPEAAADYSVTAVCKAFERPVYSLFLGRKAAPPALPFRPEVIEQTSPEKAFAVRVHTDIEEALLERILPRDGYERSVAVEANVVDGQRPARIGRRRDAIVSRARWQFSDREEAVFTV